MSLGNWAYYDSYGFIRQFCVADSADTATMATDLGCSAIEAVSTLTGTIADYYVDLSSTPTITAKTTRYSGISYIGSSTQLTLLPNPCWLTTEGQTFTCTDTVALMVYSVSGTFTVTVVAPAFYNENIEVTQL